MFTLGIGHLIDDKDTADPNDDEKADDTGHSSDPNNLMAGSRDEGGTTLTDDQIDEIKKGVKGHGSDVEVKPDAQQPKKHECDRCDGCAADDAQDPNGQQTSSAADIIDTGMCLLDAFDPNDTSIVVDFSYAGRLAPGHSIFAAIGFNTDNDQATGFDLFAPVGVPIRGNERSIVLRVGGDDPNVSPGFVQQADLLDEFGLPIAQLPVELERIVKINDEEDTGQNSAAGVYDQARVPLDPGLLPLPLSAPVSIGMLSVEILDPNGAQAPQAFDQASYSFQFNPEDFFDIFVTPTSGAPGDSVQVEGFGFWPNRAGMIELDDDPLGTFLTDGSGSFLTTFPVPPVPPGPYFVTASTTDPNDPAFAFRILDVAEPNVPVCGPECNGADLDGDCDVDLDDLTISLQNFGAGPGGDIDGDGDTDLDDLTLLLQNFGAVCP